MKAINRLDSNNLWFITYLNNNNEERIMHIKAKSSKDAERKAIKALKEMDMDKNPILSISCL